MADSVGYLWEYDASDDGTGWTQLTNTGTTPSNAKTGIFGNSSPTSLVIQDSDAVLWTSVNNGTTWTQQSGGLGQVPSSGLGVLGYPTPSAMVADTDVLWTWDGSVWTQQVGGVAEPPSMGLIGRSPTPSSIGMSDAIGNAWTYDGTDWIQLSGTGSIFSVNPGQGNVGYFLGTPAPRSVLIGDLSGNLWAFYVDTWTQVTGIGLDFPEPNPASSGFGTVTNNSTASVFVGVDGSGNFWIGQR